VSDKTVSGVFVGLFQLYVLYVKTLSYISIDR